MSEVFLDSSILIGLVFRRAQERDACRAALPSHATVVCSRYVIFEVARGFLRSRIALYNYSLECNSFAELHHAAHSGQQRYKPYKMHTWLGFFDDYFSVLDAEDGITSEALKLEELRAKLRGWIRRGWRQMQNEFPLRNSIGCREDLPPPGLRRDQRLDQALPIADCGRPEACRLQLFIQTHRPEVEAVIGGLQALPASAKDKETLSRVEGLEHLLSKIPGTPFDGKKCHRCGDALICLEPPEGQTVATKNRKHFEPLAKILGKRLAVA